MFGYRDARAGGAENRQGGRHGSTWQTRVAFTDISLDLSEAAPGHDSGLDGNDVLACLEADLGVRIARMNQVHGREVSVLDAPGGPVPTADALLTVRPGVALLVRSADCVPVLLADLEHEAIGAVHAGRLGMAAGVVTRAVEQLRDLGADQVVAWVGPHICGGCYEVPEEMRAEVAALVPESYSDTRWRTPALDIRAGVVAQLERAGCRVTRVTGCTRERARWHSYRRDGAAAGRLGGLIWMQQ